MRTPSILLDPVSTAGAVLDIRPKRPPFELLVDSVPTYGAVPRLLTVGAVVVPTGPTSELLGGVTQVIAFAVRHRTELHKGIVHQVISLLVPPEVVQQLSRTVVDREVTGQLDEAVLDRADDECVASIADLEGHVVSQALLTS
jgi:hypothetical protein